jgi:hypothetical protein
VTAVGPLAAVAGGEHVPPRRPRAKGPLSGYVLRHLADPPHALPPAPRVRPSDPLADDDLQLALYLCYELHYRGLPGVDDRWEWNPALVAFCRELEEQCEDALVGLVGSVRPRGGSTAEQLWAMIEESGGPSLSTYIEQQGTLREVQELAVHRSAYQLKEADPHTWAIPRLAGVPKAAMVEIQADEYGGGVAGEMHATLFAATMEALGLDPTYGAYLDSIPGVTLATVNLISMFGLHRRLRGALVGHLAVFEMTSVGPMGRYSRALERLGVGPEGRRFYDVHVQADAHHQAVASEAMAGRLVADEPDLAASVFFGAAAVMAIEGRFTAHVLDAWAAGRSSLVE